jgi:hypothetical protein
MLSCCNSPWLPCQANCLCLAQLCCCLLQRYCCGLPPYLLHSLHLFSWFPIDRPSRQPMAPSSMGATCKLLLLCSTFHRLPQSKPSLRASPPACGGWLLHAPSIAWLLPLAVVLLSLPVCSLLHLACIFCCCCCPSCELVCWSCRPRLYSAIRFPPPRGPPPAVTRPSR